MENKSGAKSRKEKRKEARLEKQNNRFFSWIEHQKSSKLKRNAVDSRRKVGKKSKVSFNKVSEEVEIRDLDVNAEKSIEQPSPQKESKEAFISLEDSVTTELKVKKEKKSLKTKSKTKFDEYLEMEMKKGTVSAEEDLKMERKLAKKLKVNKGKLRGEDDELNMLFDGIPSLIDSVTDKKVVDDEEEEQSSRKSSSSKKLKKRKMSFVSEEKQVDTSGDKEIGGFDPIVSAAAVVTVEEPCTKASELTENVKYIAPHLRSLSRNKSPEETFRVLVKGRLNRLLESNLESTTEEISTMYRSIDRSSGSQIISEEVLAHCARGPRGNEQNAAVFAAFVAGMACLVGINVSAKFMASLAKTFEDEYMKEENISLRNLTLLLSYCCIFGVCSSDLIYDFIIMLSKRLMEIDVSTILTILQYCGMKLRGDDPTAMKDFILSVQNRVNEMKSPSGSMPDDQLKINNKRMEFMLETICEIKNNKKKSKEDPAQHTRIKKWLQKLKVEDVLLRGIKWSKLLDPHKKGQWWLSGEMAPTTEIAEEFAGRIDREVLESQKLLQLAASQKMNTDARRAIFCIIMSGEDYVDAFEKLLRLDLNGKQDREIMRVLLDCCLQEKFFNKYYSVLASKLCSHDKNHKFTLQYCLWDHFKELESMELIRSMNLARFTVEMLASFSLSLAVLKVVDLSDPKHLTPKKAMHFRMLFEAIFEHPDTTVWNIFTRVAVAPELETLRNDLQFFIKKYVVGTNKSISGKFKISRKAFSNVAGVLM